MSSIFKRQLLLPLLGIPVVGIASAAAILFASGYRPDFENKTIAPSGILVAQSYPDTAQVLVNGELKTATDNSINLEPGKYEVEIKKDGFVPWKKNLIIEAEVVTRASATLFPSVPSLKAITTNGAANPVLSPDGSKVAYIVTEKGVSKVYALDLNESSFGFINRDPKPLIENIKSKIDTLIWSPDSRQVLITASGSATLSDISNSQKQDVTARVSLLKTTWNTETLTKELNKQSTLPEKLKLILNSSAKDISWSPKENKVLYTATASAVIESKLITPLPGSNTQTESRTLIPGGVYVYDIEEDRNFKIDEITLTTPTPTPKNKLAKDATTPTVVIQSPNAGWTWFSSSSHLLKVDNSKIYIKEYDNQNQTTIYSGPMATPFAAPYPSGKQVLILSNLNPDTSPLPNLYAISLR